MKTPRKWTITKIGSAINDRHREQHAQRVRSGPLDQVLPSLIVLFALAPAIASANIEITEIMYDQVGADSGREWIEITNLGSETVDMGKYKLFENNVNHGLTAGAGGTTLSPSAVAIIASDAQKFLADYPNFAGILFDSAFSLSNTGEELAIKNGSSTVLTETTYASTPDASGTGGSLQLKDSVLVVAMPSPGVYPGTYAPIKKATPVGKTAVKKPTTTSLSKVTKNATIKNSSTDSPAYSAPVAAAGASPWTSTIPRLWLYVAGLAGVVLVGVSGVLLVLQRREETFNAADEFTIE